MTVLWFTAKPARKSCAITRTSGKRSRTVHGVLGFLPLEPREQVAHTRLERDLGAEAEQLVRQARVRVAVADVAGAVLPDELGFHVPVEPAGDRARDVDNGRRYAGPDVQRP